MQIIIRLQDVCPYGFLVTDLESGQFCICHLFGLTLLYFA